MKLPFALLAALSFFILGSSSGHAQLIIDATFDSTITSNPNAAEIESGMNQAIGRLESYIANPITVNIDFAATNSGLGSSLTYYDTATYESYASVLAGAATSPQDVESLASVPIQPGNPVNGNPDIDLTLALFRAFGDNITPPGGFDSTISLNLGLMNLSRTGPQNPSLYDLQAVVAHEMDEVLGVGGPGTTLDGTGSLTGPIGDEDLFRYSAPGVRSYSNSSSATAYFSINGGVTDLSNFNQITGADFADWKTGSSPQVQDAFGTPGVDLNVGVSELTALDVVGYTLTPAGQRVEDGLSPLAAPEPKSVYLLFVGLIALGFYYRRRVA